MRWPARRTLLPGCDWRPWLVEQGGPRYGNETRDDRGRVRVTLGKGHRHANSAGWCWRYRLVVAYALARELQPNEHVDHIRGVIDDDRLEELQLFSAEYHGQYHARLFELAGARGPDGRFREIPGGVVWACRLGPVISMREISGATWKPMARRLDNKVHTSVR